MTWCTTGAVGAMTAFGVKRTLLTSPEMSAFDPKRTWRPTSTSAEAETLGEYDFGSTVVKVDQRLHYSSAIKTRFSV